LPQGVARKLRLFIRLIAHFGLFRVFSDLLSYHRFCTLLKIEAAEPVGVSPSLALLIVPNLEELTTIEGFPDSDDSQRSSLSHQNLNA